MKAARSLPANGSLADGESEVGLVALGAADLTPPYLPMSELDPAGLPGLSVIGPFQIMKSGIAFRYPARPLLLSLMVVVLVSRQGMFTPQLATAWADVLPPAILIPLALLLPIRFLLLQLYAGLRTRHRRHVSLLALAFFRLILLQCWKASVVHMYNKVYSLPIGDTRPTRGSRPGRECRTRTRRGRWPTWATSWRPWSRARSEFSYPASPP